MSNHCYPNEVNKSHNVYTMYFTNWFNYDSIMKTFFRYELEVLSQALTRRHQYIHTHRFFAPFQEKPLHWLSWEVWISVLTVTEPSVVHKTQVIKIANWKPMLTEVQSWSYDTEFLKHSGDHVCLKLHLINDCLPMIKASNIVLHLASTVNRWIVSV